MAVMTSAYAQAGIDTDLAKKATTGLVEVLQQIKLARPPASVLQSGHYANVLRLSESLGLALATDGVGSKALLAEDLGRFDTIGRDCVAMNANDVVCVGADPIALLDYISVERADPHLLRDLAVGLKAGAEEAGIEIPGGEVAQLPEMISGRGKGLGFDLVGACVGTVPLEAIVTGTRIEVGDVIVGLPSSGVHANGLTLARQALWNLDERPTELAGKTIGEVLLEPTVIYVEAIRALLASEVDVRGLAHITSYSFRNLLRLDAPVGYRIDATLWRPPIFDLIAERSGTDLAEMWDVFNMGCGFCCIVPVADGERAEQLLSRFHPGTQVVGTTTSNRGVVQLVEDQLIGTADERFTSG